MMATFRSLRGASRPLAALSWNQRGAGLPLLGTRWHKTVAADDSTEKISFHFKLRDGSRKTVSVPLGVTVLEAAHMNEVDLEGACEASLACSTCHVILNEDTYESCGEPTEKEEDLLDLAPCLTPTSRLACQVVVDEKLKDHTVTLPAMTLNFYVDGHVPTPH
ncbi:MFDX1 [Symbiodinium natans]|uniref:2Fe-2S ferredoxin n=1 Tax=Symbiodinium natans TaxID=878477 RepID=A0A812TIC3_9DINO|nr:MFDX1 [Symbiodinium natans]